ncbi:glucosaminidase domain-containing protein [Paenibacillus septentrionalis]|uniref:Glucosaminidase domain-containing protein n=1 Tax=Paenibacillus septentrionalis TaxID=429342 RepID=A0ABW1V0G8_9BACL
MAELSRQQFFDTIAPVIVFVRQQGSPILPSVRLAQSLLETGGVIHAWNNLGGIKVGSGRLTPYWRGESVTRGTWEVRGGQEVRESAAFRAYRTLYHYFKDQDELFMNSRYSRVRTATTPYEQAEQMRLAGYATDPNYASKIMALIRQYQLERYDAVPPLVIPDVFEGAEIVPIYVNQQFFGPAYYERGTNYVPVRSVAEHFGARVIWRDGNVYVNGAQLETRLARGTSYATARELARHINLALEWDSNAKVLFVH